MVKLNDFDGTGHAVPLKKLPSCLLFSRMPLGNMVFGDEGVPVEITSAVPNGSIVVGIGDKDKRYYIVQTIDIVYAAYQADRALRGIEQKEDVEP
jgi:hypothetical protein